MLSFIDKTGHIYSIESYDSYPVGYEFRELDYKLRMEECCGVKLSINNYYIRPVHVLINMEDDDILELDIESSSKVFRLIGGKDIQNLINETGSLYIEFNENSEIIKDKLTKDDLLYINNLDDDRIVTTVATFYIIAYTEDPCEWTSNIMIHMKQYQTEEWCPLAVCGDFYNEREELQVNANNLGITVSKDILKAVWGTSIYNDVPDEVLYDQKVKEYLLNYMLLRGEKGNIEQAQSALEWFGWGKKLDLVKLIQTDNELIAQYVRDVINIENDFLTRWDHFKSTGYLSVICPITKENGKVGKQNWNNESGFIGEGLPLLDNLFDIMTYEVYDEEDIKFYRPYFDYTFTELALKLSALRDFYIKEFLPLHSYVQSAALQVQCFTPDIKYHTRCFEKISESPLLTCQKHCTINVQWPSESTIFIYNQIAYADDHMNEMSWYKEEAGDFIETKIYYIDDAIAKIPIKITSDITDIFNCVLVLERNGQKMYESNFSFCQQNGTRDWDNFILFPRLFNERTTMNYWDNKDYIIYLCVNGQWFTWKFHMQTPEMNMQLGRLEYRYDNLLQRQVNSITNDGVDFQVHMYLPSLIDVRNINFPNNVVDYMNDGQLYKFLRMYREHPSLPYSYSSVSAKYWNQVHMYKLIDTDGNEILYNPEESQVSLYRKFFKDNGEQRQVLKKGTIEYDLYLMHDSTEFKDYEGILSEANFRKLVPRWYIILISRQTINERSSDEDLNAPIVTAQGLRTELVGSDKKWLINRMYYIDCTEKPVFNTDDIIVGTTSNVDMPFILTHGSKWEIVPFSLGMQKDAKVSSTTNTFIMSLGTDNYSNECGYYNITARYSLDGEVANQKKLELRFLVK